MAKQTLVLALSDLVPMNPVLTALAGRDDLPITTSFRLAVFLNQAKTHFETFERSRAAIIKKYGTPNEATEEQIAANIDPGYTMAPEVQAEANADMAKLVAETVAFTGVRKFALSDFGDAKGLRPADFLVLNPLIDFGDEDESESEPVRSIAAETDGSVLNPDPAASA